MARLAVSRSFWAGRKVFLTGHSGFKGSWLALWLTDLGAEVYGYSLAPCTSPALYDNLGLAQRMAAEFADIRDAERLAQSLLAFGPDTVLHLAAQPLVRESYRAPAQTYATNVTGTLNILEAVRQCETVRAVVVVTSDKCYENREWSWPYREQDALGGHDPYSSSKACVELLCASWRESFLRERGVVLATARAGNVIGGGDWSVDRLVPDILRAWGTGESVTLRYPEAVRPWQHVLDPLKGYLLLAQALHQQGQEMAQAWNFGPDSEGTASVAEVVQAMARLWPGDARWAIGHAAQPHEAGLLTLDSSRARGQLGWRPQWDLQQALQQTLEWHRAWRDGQDMQQFSRAQIAAHEGENR
ncbi:CDP-glucose 4,6-dehydratase [Pseudomonas promysalinigenes]|uniref:CDP-glucose 4,6-dehydratase n=1 Tax=Pseudomonas promysalinigenes TaxID=485898 RepID=UPI003916D6C3